MPASKAHPKIRLSVAYAYAICKYGYPPSFKDMDLALVELSKLGFRYTEFEGLGRDWNMRFLKQRKRYQKMLSDLGIHVHNYCIVDPKLVSSNRAERTKAYELYDLGCENAAAFGCLTVHIATYGPPLIYERVPYKLGEAYNFNLDYRARIPAGFSWQKDWDVLVESCQRVARAADKHGLDVLVEPRVGERICNTESMLNLIRDVNHPRLKANFDFAHLVAQKENLSLSWERLRPHVGGIHIADNNTRDVEHLQLGKGVIDWEQILRQVCDSGYDRYIGLDLFVKPTQAAKAFTDGRKRLADMIRQFKLDDHFDAESFGKSLAKK